MRNTSANWSFLKWKRAFKKYCEDTTMSNCLCHMTYLLLAKQIQITRIYNQRVDTIKQESSPASARLLKKATNAANENVGLQINDYKTGLMSSSSRKTS